MKHKKGRWLPRSLGILLALFFLWSVSTNVVSVRHLVERLELLAYDLRLNFSLPAASVDKRIVIVDIDEKSLKAEGQWPWPRNKIAAMVEHLFSDGATVVAFDMVFPEEERNSAIEVAQQLQGRIKQHDLIDVLRSNAALFDNDKTLAQAIHQHDTVLGFTLQPNPELHAGVLPLPLRLESDGVAPDIALLTTDGYVSNNAILQSSQQKAGFFSLNRPDIDGIIRRVPLLMRQDNNVYPSLALETLQLYLLADKVTPLVAKVQGQNILEGLRIGELTIPTDKYGSVIVPYRGRKGSFPYISATDVIHGNKSTSALSGAIVLIGTTATGLNDLRATPVGAVYPGVEVHANILSGMLDNHFPSEPSWAEGVNYTVIVLLGICLAVLLPALSSQYMILVSISCALLVAFANIWLWESRGLIFQLATPLLLVISLAAMNIAYGFLTESKGRQRLKEMFGQYVPPELVEEMSQNPESFGFEGESREMTVLFSDVRGFTTISESLTAVKLKSLLNEFFTPMTKIIFENRGTIDKYVGDMIMAFWGAPLKDESHTYHAVLTAMAMIRETRRLNKEFAAKGFPEVNIGIGVNTGIMNVGDMGSTFRRSYTVIGDSVNLGSRLESVTKYYDVPIVVGEQTYDLTNTKILYRELDLIRVKGKHHAVHIYQPLCLMSEASTHLQDEVNLLQQAITHYRSARWDDAKQVFHRLLEQRPAEHLYKLYLERIQRLSVTPLIDWDGVYERDTK